MALKRLVPDFQTAGRMKKDKKNMVEVRSWLAGPVVQSRVPDTLFPRRSSFPGIAGHWLWSAPASEGRALERKIQAFNLGGRLPAFAALSHVSRAGRGGGSGMKWGSLAAHPLKVWCPSLPPRAPAEPKSSWHPDEDKSRAEVSFNPTSPSQRASPGAFSKYLLSTPPPHPLTFSSSGLERINQFPFFLPAGEGGRWRQVCVGVWGAGVGLDWGWPWQPRRRPRPQGETPVASKVAPVAFWGKTKIKCDPGYQRPKLGTQGTYSAPPDVYSAISSL